MQVYTGTFKISSKRMSSIAFAKGLIYYKKNEKEKISNNNFLGLFYYYILPPMPCKASIF
jgi:hypothetical protein